MPAHRKVLTQQIDIIIGFMESNQDFKGDPRLRNLNNKQWECLAEKLNCVRNGATKSVKNWKSYWRDYKYRVRKKRSEHSTIYNSSTLPRMTDSVEDCDSQMLTTIEIQDKPIQCPDYENSSASSVIQDVKVSPSREPSSPKDIETPCSDSDDVHQIPKLNRPSTPPVLTDQAICSDCFLYDDDRRNEIFGKLLEEEFKYIMPCARTECYQEILKYLQRVKGQHLKDIS